MMSSVLRFMTTLRRVWSSPGWWLNVWQQHECRVASHHPDRERRPVAHDFVPGRCPRGPTDRRPARARLGPRQACHHIARVSVNHVVGELGGSHRRVVDSRVRDSGNNVDEPPYRGPALVVEEVPQCGCRMGAACSSDGDGLQRGHSRHWVDVSWPPLHGVHGQEGVVGVEFHCDQ
jgi:hypothetical protein